jgi:hypothetical protein
VLTGEHGTAKSTFARIMRALLDPHTTPLRSPPREDRDLFIAANNGWVIAVDNVSKLPDWLSDLVTYNYLITLCHYERVPVKPKHEPIQRRWGHSGFQPT